MAGVSTGYLYDGPNAVQELSATGVRADLLNSLGIDQVLARTDSAGSFLSDALGSTLALSDAAGAVQTSYSYEPYGKTTTSRATSDNSLQYTGRENDGTGLYFYRARYFDPSKGRFLQSDPIGLAGGINAFSYVRGDPLNLRDPYGMQPWLGEFLAHIHHAGVRWTGTGIALDISFELGWYVGTQINESWESSHGQSIGGSAYDWVHPDLPWPRGKLPPLPSN